MHFGGNQLYRHSISFSLLPTPHRTGFQPGPVRASGWFYPSFTLGMGRSWRFGSAASDFGRPVRTRFPYGFVPEGLSLATDGNSLAHYAKGTRSGAFSPKRENSPSAVRRLGVSGSISLPSSGFFSPFPHGTCALSVGREYLALEGGPP